MRSDRRTASQRLIPPRGVSPSLAALIWQTTRPGDFFHRNRGRIALERRTDRMYGNRRLIGNLVLFTSGPHTAAEIASPDVPCDDPGQRVMLSQLRRQRKSYCLAAAPGSRF